MPMTTLKTCLDLKESRASFITEGLNGSYITGSAINPQAFKRT